MLILISREIVSKIENDKHGFETHPSPVNKVIFFQKLCNVYVCVLRKSSLRNVVGTNTGEVNVILWKMRWLRYSQLTPKSSPTAGALRWRENFSIWIDNGITVRMSKQIHENISIHPIALYFDVNYWSTSSHRPPTDHISKLTVIL